jgi:hypothetical protein
MNYFNGFGRAAIALLALVFCALPGCVDGPFSRMAEWNPWYTKQWQKDEAKGPTFHKRFAELRSLQSQASRLSPEDQAAYINQLAVLIRSDSNPVIRAEVVRTLALFPNQAIIPPLRQALTDEEPSVRIAACRAWGKVGGAEGLQSLAERVSKDENIDVKICAAKELGQFKDQAAVVALGSALEENDPALQYQAMQSLKSCSGRDFGVSVASWREFVAGRNPPPPESPSMAQRLRQLF